MERKKRLEIVKKDIEMQECTFQPNTRKARLSLAKKSDQEEEYFPKKAIILAMNESKDQPYSKIDQNSTFQNDSIAVRD